MCNLQPTASLEFPELHKVPNLEENMYVHPHVQWSSCMKLSLPHALTACPPGHATYACESAARSVTLGSRASEGAGQKGTAHGTPHAHWSSRINCPSFACCVFVAQEEASDRTFCD